METLRINPLQLQVSRIGLGTWAIGGVNWGGSDETDGIKTILKAFELKINLIDTAPAYGFGNSETIVGKAIKLYGEREKIVIATKCGLEWENSKKLIRNCSPKRIKKEVEDSLKRLQTDYIDIYQIHWPDPLVPLAETAYAMLSLLQEGKIRAIGVSNFSTAQMEEFMKVAPIHTSQPPYNLVERNIEKEIFPFTEKFNIPTLSYGSLCRGLLSGRMTAHTRFAGDDIRKYDPKFHEPNFSRYLAAVDALNKFSQHEYGQKVISLAIRWILDHGRTVALWGARQPTQLKGVKDILGWTLDADAMKIIDNILRLHVPHPIGSEFMAPSVRKHSTPA